MASRQTKARNDKKSSDGQGLGKPSASPEHGHLAEATEEKDPPNRAVLDAIMTLRDEVAQIKTDVCAIIDTRIKDTYNDLKEEIISATSSLQTSITKLEATTASHDTTIKEIERSTTDHSDSVTTLQRQVTYLKSEMEKYAQKCEDLEARSRRNNVRIVGIAEGEEGPKPRNFTAKLLQDVLSLDEPPLIDRAHRTLRQRPGPGTPPRPFVVRLHYYHTTEYILNKAATTTRDGKNLQYQGKKIHIFPDYPPTIVKQRALFTRTREILRNQPGVKYGLLYPARLLVTYKGVQTSFTDPQKAQTYAEQLFGIRSDHSPIPAK